MSKVELGGKYKDLITDFEGVATGRSEYISGCVSILLAPKAVKGELKDGQWFDEQRLVRTSPDVIKLNNAATPGPDVMVPKR